MWVWVLCVGVGVGVGVVCVCVYITEQKVLTVRVYGTMHTPQNALMVST